MLDVKVGCLGLTWFGSGRCSAGFMDAPMGFGYSRVTGLLGGYNSLDIPMCVTDDSVRTKFSRVL